MAGVGLCAVGGLLRSGVSVFAKADSSEVGSGMGCRSKEAFDPS